MDVTAHNIANLNTVGFRAERPVFANYMQRTGEDIRTDFVIDRATYTVAREGALSETGNPFHLAIRGDGFFAVETPQGERYTRDGRFQLDDLGRLVSLAGRPVLDQGSGEIVIPEDAETVDIARDGTVSADGDIIARIGLVRFEADNALLREEDGLYRSDEIPAAAADASVVQGMVENSNVQPIVEMTRMMEISRAYMANSRLIEGEDERQRGMIGKLGDPRI